MDGVVNSIHWSFVCDRSPGVGVSSSWLIDQRQDSRSPKTVCAGLDGGALLQQQQQCSAVGALV